MTRGGLVVFMILNTGRMELIGDADVAAVLHGVLPPTGDTYRG